MVMHLGKQETKEKGGIEYDQLTRKGKEKIGDDGEIVMYLSL